MKKVILAFATLIFFIGGCVSPKTLYPVAQKNVENIRVLVLNTETLGAISSKAMETVTQIAVIQRERKVTAFLFPYINEEERESRDKKFKSEVEALRKEIEHRRQNLSKEKFDSYLNGLFLEKPGVADVAANQKNLLQTLEELDILANLGLQKPELIASKGHMYIAEFQAVKLVIQARMDVISAFNQFIKELSKQGGLAEKHALAFLDFSKTEADPAIIISGLAKNQEFAKAVGTIVLNRTNDTVRAKAAEDLIESVTKSANATEG